MEALKAMLDRICDYAKKENHICLPADQPMCSLSDSSNLSCSQAFASPLPLPHIPLAHFS